MNHFEEILKIIKSKEKYAAMNHANELDMLRHFIELMGEKYFNTTFQIRFIDSNNKFFDEDFYEFHKSMRQCDFYNDHYTTMAADDPERNKFIKGTEYKSIGGHLDMLFWHFIHLSDTPSEVLKTYVEKIKAIV
jgi:tRNA nucleotidyltransferase/poly(A) polymerase